MKHADGVFFFDTIVWSLELNSGRTFTLTLIVDIIVAFKPFFTRLCGDSSAWGQVGLCSTAQRSARALNLAIDCGPL